jgi:prevent-host-death family protein
MGRTMSLSDAKAHLSDVVRRVRARGEEAVITVDGEPAARIVPIRRAPRELSPAEVATFRALLAAVRRIARPESDFDAVELIRDGRR